MVHHFGLPAAVYPILSANFLMIVYFYYLFYFRPCPLCNDQLEEVLFRRGTPKKKSHQTSAKYHSKDTSTTQHHRLLLPPPPPQTAHFFPNFQPHRAGFVDVWTLIRLFAASVSNALESFIVLVDLVALWGCLHCGGLFCRQVLQVEKEEEEGRCSLQEIFEKVLLDSSRQLTVVLPALTLFLLHGLVQMVALYGLLYILGFSAAYTVISIGYLFRSVQQNNAQLRQAVRGRKGKNAYFLLRTALRGNLAIFRLLFARNAFLSSAFLAYLLVNYPTGALATVVLLFDRGRLGNSFYLLLAVSGFALNELLGTFLVHLTMARFSRTLHRGAVHLASFSACSGVLRAQKEKLANENKEKEKTKMRDQKIKDKAKYQKREKNYRSALSRNQLTVWAHTMRLLTANRYGFTYGVVGISVSMDVFVKVSGKEFGNHKA